MLARRADSFLSTSIEICEVFQQPDKPPTCGSHRLRKLSSCVAKQQEVDGPASIPALKRIAVFSSHRQSSSDFCATSITVWARGPGILWRRAVCLTSSIALYSSSASIASANFFYLLVYRLLCRSRPSPIQRRRSNGLFGHCSARRSLTTWAQVPGDQVFFRRPASIRALLRRHPEMSGRRAPDDGGPNLSSRDAPCVFEIILPVRPAAV